MRRAPAGVALLLLLLLFASCLASCTLMVPIDDGLSDGVLDGGSSPADVTSPTTGDGGTGPKAEAGDGATNENEICPGPVDDPDLVGWYPLNETEGDIAHDCSPSKEDLKPLGAIAPAWTKGKLGGGADFDGLNTCFTAQGGSAFRFDEGEPFTVAAWVFVRQFNEADKTGRWVASHKVSPNGWHFGADDPDRIEIDFEYVIGPTDKKTQVSGPTTARQWIHVLATYAPGDASLYIDGKQKQRTTGATIPAAFNDLNGRFHLGCRNVKVNVFDGIIDDLRIYRRAFTAAEAAALAARP